jgi:predicted nucleic acid-binding protein
VTGPVVADAGPLVGLARIGLLGILRDLYQEILIPPGVFDELRVSESRPGSKALLEAVRAEWLLRVEPEAAEDLQSLRLLVDPGEAEAIMLALQRGSRFLLIDDKQGRALARSRGLRIVGTGGVLLSAKERELIEQISPVLDQLTAGGYRLSAELKKEIMKLAGETAPGPAGREQP